MESAGPDRFCQSLALPSHPPDKFCQSVEKEPAKLDLSSQSLALPSHPQTRPAQVWHNQATPVTRVWRSPVNPDLPYKSVAQASNLRDQSVENDPAMLACHSPDLIIVKDQAEQELPGLSLAHPSHPHLPHLPRLHPNLSVLQEPAKPDLYGQSLAHLSHHRPKHKTGPTTSHSPKKNKSPNSKRKPRNENPKVFRKPPQNKKYHKVENVRPVCLSRACGPVANDILKTA
jgi:hypothetical protein